MRGIRIIKSREMDQCIRASRCCLYPSKGDSRSVQAHPRPVPEKSNVFHPATSADFSLFSRKLNLQQKATSMFRSRTHGLPVLLLSAWVWTCLVATGTGQEIDPAQLEALSARQQALQRELIGLQEEWLRQGTQHGIHYGVNGEEAISDIADIAVHLKAIEWIVRHVEFDKKATFKQAEQVLEAGAALLQQLQSGAGRSYLPGSQIAGYVSAVDHSVQPYAVSLPADFPLDGSRAQRYPLYVVLHGRGGMNEVGFIARHRNKPPAEGQQWIQIDVFGRIDNAYRWAGETDVFEAIRDVSRRFPIDEARVTLWGFSMGGAGAWHLGLQYPDRWASIGAGAGFVDFYKYQKKTELLPAYQHSALSIYDTEKYARNLANVNFVTYGGDQDPQIASSQIMVAAAEKYGIPVKFIVGRDAGHKFTPEASREFQEYLWQHNQAGKPRYPGPREIRFVTYTPKYNECYWLRIEELEEMYQETIVESKYDADSGTLLLETQNVALVHLSRDIADQVAFDGEPPLPLGDAAEGLLPGVHFQKRDAGWEVLSYDDSRAYQEGNPDRKIKNLQGPIDDAFMQPFLCVRGTGKPWSEPHEAWAQWTLNRFEREFDKWMRGKIRIVNDTEVTPDMISRYHLILFGDPGSNALIARMQAGLPLQWSPQGYELAGQAWSHADHGVALIYPNPLNRRKYVVLNSGMTTHEQDFKASNAWLFPKLGDVAVIHFEQQSPTPPAATHVETVAWAALFDANWELPETP